MIELRKSIETDIPVFIELERSEGASEFIIPYTLKEHLAAIHNKSLLYLSIYKDNALQGFFILSVKNESNVEFRRIVVGLKGAGIGQTSIALMEKYCKEHLSTKRIWLDVFSFNKRGLHIYKKLGYKQFGINEHNGKQLLLFEKHI